MVSNPLPLTESPPPFGRPPFAPWLEQNWYVRESTTYNTVYDTKLEGYRRVPAVVALSLYPVARPWIHELTQGQRLIHWNERHGDIAAIEAVRVYDATGEMPLCPGHIDGTYEPRSELGRCPYPRPDRFDPAEWEWVDSAD